MKIDRNLEVERLRLTSLEDLIDTYKSDELTKEEEFYKDMILRNIILKQITNDDIDNIIEQLSEMKSSEINSQMAIVDNWYNKMSNEGCQYWVNREGSIEELEAIRNVFGETHVDVDTNHLRQMADIVFDISNEVSFDTDLQKAISRIDGHIKEFIIEAVDYYNQNNNNAAFTSIDKYFEKINDQKFITNLYYEIIYSNILHHEIMPFVKKYLPSTKQDCNYKIITDELTRIIGKLEEIKIQLGD